MAYKKTYTIGLLEITSVNTEYVSAEIRYQDSNSNLKTINFKFDIYCLYPLIKAFWKMFFNRKKAAEDLRDFLNETPEEKQINEYFKNKV